MPRIKQGALTKEDERKIKTLKEVVGEVEKEHILSVLDQTGGNIQRTSRILDIARNTLKTRLSEYGIRTS